MSTLRRILVPWAFYAVLALVASSVVILGTLAARKVMAARDAEQRVCAAELKAILARNAFVQRFALPVDKCRARDVVARGGI